MKILKKIVNIILVLIICICSYKIVDKVMEYKKADNVYEKIRIEKEELKNSYINNEDDTGEDGIGNIFIDNEDYRGWLNVENTNIDYPILQSYDNQYYLDKDINGEYLMSGSIFMNYLNDGFNDENTVLFGHNMRNGTMFAQLKKYKDRDFFYENNNINIELSNGEILKYEVFSVYVTDIEDNYIQTKFDNVYEYKEFLERIKNKSIYESEIELCEDDQIITLSTCSFEFDDARLVVHGKLIRN